MLRSSRGWQLTRPIARILWVSGSKTVGRTVVRTDKPDSNPHTRACEGPPLCSKTTSGGLSWSTPKEIVSFTASNQHTIANQIVVDPNTGTLYDFFDLIKPPKSPSPYNVAFVK